jgi:EpsI family protein
MQDVMKLNHANRNIVMQLMILCGAFIFCYIKGISQLVSFWRNSYVYSYGFLIPFISLYLVWLNRKKLNFIQPVPNCLLGLSLILGGLSLYILGNRSGVFVIESLSIIFTISGVVLSIFGKRVFLVLLFPIAYLLFMIPIWDYLTEKLQFPFQVFTAYSASQLLNLVGLPVFRDSVFLELPNITLEVATVCSGINNLIAVLAIALPLAYISLKSWPRRIILVSGGIVIAALSNGLRVAIMGFLAYYGISATLHGPGHILQAMFVSFVGFIVLFIGAWLLSDRHAEPAISSDPGKDSSHNTAFTDDSISKSHNPVSSHLMYTTSAILLLTGIYVNFFTPSPVPLKSGLNLFPYKIGQYKGEDAQVDHKISEMINSEISMERTYSTVSGRQMDLYIGYLESQGQGKELVNYKSAGFHDGASREKITTNTNTTVEINKVLRQKNGTEKVLYFWYDLNGAVIADRNHAKVRTALDSIIRRRSNGAFIMVSTALDKSEENPKVFKESEDFIRLLIPVLHEYLP